MAPRSLYLLVSLTVLAAVVAVSADPPRPRLIDFNPWAWLPTSRNRSPAIMDYFFPPSRTPKHSNLDPPADRTPPATAVPRPTTPQEKTTNADVQTTVSTRKSSATVGKTKSTVPATVASAYPTTATSPPKTKKQSQKTSAPPETTFEVKTTQSMKTEKTSNGTTTSIGSTASSTAKPTKRYTIHPLRNTENPTVQQTDTTWNTESDSTESVADVSDSSDTTGTTFALPGKETSPTLSTVAESRATDMGPGSTTVAEASTQVPDEADSREGYLPLRDKPQQTHVKLNEQTKKETVPLPAGSTSVLAKPTKYHYYPHNQHIYLLPECAIQQVCNAVYVRLNYTQPLCACPSRYRDPCSASLNADDLHTTRLTTDSKKKFAHKAVTLVKTCEAVSEMRECRAPRDWSLLALQNIRTGKSHYLVICRCPENHILEGPMSHDQPTYASVPGIRVYGMMCVRPTSYQTSGYSANRYTAVTIQSTTSPYKVDYSQPHYNQDKPAHNRFTSHSYLAPNYYNRMSRVARVRRMAQNSPPFPWYKVREFASTIDWTQ